MHIFLNKNIGGGFFSNEDQKAEEESSITPHSSFSSSFESTTPSSPSTSFTAEKSEIKTEEHSSSSDVEHLANSIVMRSLQESPSRASNSLKDHLMKQSLEVPNPSNHSIATMINDIQATAKQFVGEINKKEASLAPEYKKDLDKLKAISEKIIKAEQQKQAEEQKKVAQAIAVAHVETQKQTVQKQASSTSSETKKEVQ